MLLWSFWNDREKSVVKVFLCNCLQELTAFPNNSIHLWKQWCIYGVSSEVQVIYYIWKWLYSVACTTFVSASLSGTQLVIWRKLYVTFIRYNTHLSKQKLLFANVSIKLRKYYFRAFNQNSKRTHALTHARTHTHTHTKQNKTKF